MRIPLLLAALASAVSASAADAAPRARSLQHVSEQDAAYQAAQQGRILPLPEIRARVRIPGAQFIGAEFDGRVYRLKFIRGAEVIWVDVDARSGKILGRQ